MLNTSPSRSPLVAGAVVALCLTLTACSSSSADKTREPTGASSQSSPTLVGTPSPDAVPALHRVSGDPAYLRRIETGGAPCATLGAAGSVWVADINGARVSRLNPRTGRVMAVVKTGNSPCGMAYGAGSVWVEDYGAADVTRIMLPSLKTKRYPVGSLPYDVAFAAGAAWVTNYGDDTVTRVDADTGRRTTIDVGALPVGIAPSGGALWVGNSDDGTISHIDENTLKVTTVHSGGTPGWTAYDADSVWVGDASKGQVIRIDSATGQIVARVTVGPQPNDGDVYRGYLWVPDAVNGLYRVDIATNKVAGRFGLGANDPFVADGFDGRLWIADFKGTETFVVDPSELPRAP